MTARTIFLIIRTISHIFTSVYSPLWRPSPLSMSFLQQQYRTVASQHSLRRALLALNASPPTKPSQKTAYRPFPPFSSYILSVNILYKPRTRLQSTVQCPHTHPTSTQTRPSRTQARPTITARKHDQHTCKHNYHDIQTQPLWHTNTAANIIQKTRKRPATARKTGLL